MAVPSPCAIAHRAMGITLLFAAAPCRASFDAISRARLPCQGGIPGDGTLGRGSPSPCRECNRGKRVNPDEPVTIWGPRPHLLSEIAVFITWASLRSIAEALAARSRRPRLAAELSASSCKTELRSHCDMGRRISGPSWLRAHW
jgi:hypothetical protein